MPIAMVCNFPTVACYGAGYMDIMECLKSSPVVEVRAVCVSAGWALIFMCGRDRNESRVQVDATELVLLLKSSG